MLVKAVLKTDTTVVGRFRNGKHKGLTIDTPQGHIVLECDDKVIKSLRDHLFSLQKP